MINIKLNISLIHYNGDINLKNVVRVNQHFKVRGAESLLYPNMEPGNLHVSQPVI